MQTFEYQNKIYSFIYAADFLKNPKKYLWQKYDIIKGSKYLNVGSGFDIETTRIDEHHSTMYMWQYAIGSLVIIGRKWHEFTDTLDVISSILDLSDDRKLLTFVHNLSFEWQFIHKHLNFKYDKKYKRLKVFATEERKIIYFETVQNIEFRDSLILTQRPLDKLASGYNLSTKKLVGDIDYSLKYYTETPLDNNHLAYAINDVKILVEFFGKYANREFLSKQIKLPLTMTGIVRDELKRTFKSLPKDERERYKRDLQRAYPTEEEYKSIMKWLFRGGYVHANGAAADETLINLLMGSQDFKSSYPAILLHEDLPFEFVKKPKKYFDIIKSNRKWIAKNSFYGLFKITNIHAKYPHTIESFSKLVKYDSQSLVLDNGRLLSCNEIYVLLTEYDYLLYNDFYNFETIECVSELRVAEKKPLPKWFKDIILKYFYLKETLEKDSLEYKIAKSKLNSLYGMCVTSLLNRNLSYNANESKFDLLPPEKTFDELKKKEILSPYTGIYTTAIARYNLLHYGFYKFCKSKSYSQALYGDTDSIKYTNIIGNQYIFDCYNDKMQRINNTMYVGNYNREIFKDLGKFDFEHKYYKFKTLGAKRYIYSEVDYNKKSNKYELVDCVTVAGCRKGKLQEYCKEKDLNMYDTFTNKLQLDEKHSGKKTTHYNDDPFILTVKDEFGNIQQIEELSCVTLNDIPFTMKVTQDYIDTILYLKEKNKRRVGDRIW